MSWKMMNVAQR